MIDIDEKPQTNMLFVTADEFPTFRPDVEILFGKYFKQKGYQIDWIVRAFESNHPAGYQRWQDSDVWVAKTNTGSGRYHRVMKHLYSITNELRMFGLLRKRRYDILQVKDKFIAAIIGILACIGTKTKFVYWLSFPYPEASFLMANTEGARYPKFYYLRGIVLDVLLYRVISPLADQIVVQSDAMKAQMAKRGVDPNKMTPLPMGVDQSILEYSSEAPIGSAEDTQRKIVYLGALDRIRNLDMIVDAFARVAARHPDTQLIFVGDSEEPSDKAYLAAEAERLGVADRVKFTGFLPREKALTYIQTATVCLAPVPRGPAFDVSSPTKTLEYMAMGKAVVANDIPDTELVLQSSSGGICTKFDAQAFAEGIDWILNNPQEADEMGKRGREYIIKNRTYAALADEMELEYNRHLFPERVGKELSA